MAVGRITGPLLAKNLLRDGVDLAFENDLLYLDVTTGRIGVKTADPGYTLDVQGDTNVLSLRVQTTSTLGNLQVYSTTAGSYLNNTLGDVFIQAPKDNKIQLRNDTLVSGNLHATGNITANGSVQIGNMTGSDTLSLYADIVSDITPQTPNQYNIGAEDREWAKAYINTLVAQSLVGPAGQDVNITPAYGYTTNINSNVRIWGDNPLGTGPVVSNILYVSTDGSDTNDGRAADPSRACRTISGAVKSPFYKEGTSIKVAPGHYYENNPIELKPLTSVIGSDLRTTFVEPINKTQDLFHVRSGCYIAQMQMTNGQSGLLPGTGYTAGTNRGAYAVAFPPNYGGAKIDLYYSPYIQNCTNQSGPWLLDGTMFVPNQTVQVPTGVGEATWEYNTTTMLVTMEEGVVRVGDTINIGPTKPGYVNARTLLLANKAFLQEQVVAYIDQKYEYYGYDEDKCMRDTGLIVDSLITDLVFPDNGYTQSNFAGLQYWSQTGYTGAIESELNTTTYAINYANSLAQQVIRNVTTGTRYQSTVSQVTGTPATVDQISVVDEKFTVIVDILNTGTVGVTDIVEPNDILSSVSAPSQNAYNLLQANKTYIQAETVAYVQSAFGEGFTYDQVKCYRDTGLIVDAIVTDLLFSTSSQATFAGLQYWNHGSYVGAIEGELTTTTNAVNYLSSLAQQVVVNDPSGTRYQATLTQNISLPSATVGEQLTISNEFGLITTILTTGVSGVTDDIISNGVTELTTASIRRAYDSLQANKAYLQAETVAYVEATKTPGFTYDQEKCYRDAGYMIDSISFDLLYGGNLQAIQSGVYYYSFNGSSTALPSEQLQAIAAYNYLKSLIPSVVQGIEVTSPLQTTSTQVISTATGTLIEAATLQASIDTITGIIDNGPGVANAPTSINLAISTSTNTVNAALLLNANREFLQAEIVAYVNSSFGPFVFDNEKCYRDVGYMIDCVAFDVLYGGNRQSVQAGVYYYGFSNTSSVIAKERPQTTAAYYRIREIVEQLITNETVIKSPGNTSEQNISLPPATSLEAADLKSMVDLITEIINAGPAAADTPIPIEQSPSVDANVLKAAAILQANKAFIIDEVIAFVEYTYNNGYAYNQPKCYRDTGLIVDSIAQDLIYNGDTQSTFAGLQYWNQATYTGQISTEVTATLAAIDYASSIATQVILNNTGTRYQATLTQVTNFTYDKEKCSRDTGLIVDAIALDLLFDGTSQSTFAGVQYWNHDGYVGAIASELTTTTNTINYIKSLAQQVVLNITTGTRYQDVVDQDTTNPNATTVEQAIIGNAFSTITNILSTGTAGITDKIVPNGISSSTSVNVWNAYKSLQTNKEYLKAEAIAFVEGTKSLGYDYDPVKCARDVGFMIDSVSFDLLYSGNMQSIMSGVYYYGFNASSTALPGEQTQAVAGYNYIRSIVGNIVTGVPLVSPYQTTVAQVTSTSIATITEANTIRDKIDIITDIIINGPGVANSPEPIGLVASTSAEVINATALLKANRNFLKAETVAFIDRAIGTTATIAELELIANEFGIISSIVENGTLGVTDLIEPNSLPSNTTTIVNAYSLLQSNKAYIQAETVAYINSTYKIFDQDKCARDTGLVIDAITQDLLFTTSSQSTFAGLQYWNQGGYTGDIPNEVSTTTAAINWVRDIAKKVIINDETGLRLSLGTQLTDPINPGTNAEVTIVGNEFDLVVHIITSGTSGVTDLIIPNGLSFTEEQNKINAYNLLQANKAYLQGEAIAFVEAYKPLDYVYDQTKCSRDVAYIIDSICFDLVYGGNRQAIQSGVYYYGFNGASSAIPGESANAIAAYNRLRELVPYVIQGISYPTPSQLDETQVLSTVTGTLSESTSVQSKIDIITGIIQTGPTGITAKNPIPLTANTSSSTVNAVSLLSQNRDWLVAEVLAYISNPADFLYDQSKCYRDVGYMIDCVSYDILHGGNRQAVQAGVYYYDFSNNTAIPNEIPQTISAYNHIKNIVGKIITNQIVTPSSGNTVTQVTLSSTATSIEVNSVYDKISVITDIINNGPSVAAIPEPISQTITTSTTALAAYDLLIANKEFIQAETVAFVNLFDTGFVYNRAKCIRDIGIVVENVAYDVAFGGNEKSREAGLAYWNGVTSYISNEITETTDAFNYLASLAQNVISNTTATNLMNEYQAAPQVINENLTGGDVAGSVITKLVAIINDIIANGPEVAPIRQPGNGPDWGTVSAEVLLQTNRSFIQNEIISWINYNYPDFLYREDRCYRDMGWIIDAITQDIVLNGNVKTIEAAKTYWTGNKNVLVNASYGNKDQMVETLAALTRAKDVALQVINNTTVTTTSFVFDPTRCSRDTGLIVDALSQDLLFGGDSQTTFAGIQYWNHGDYVGKVSSEITTTTAAINYISGLAQKVVQNITTGVRYQTTVTQVTTLTGATVSEANAIAVNFSTVTNILTNGVDGITDKIVPNNLTASGNVNVRRAFDVLQANKDYLKAEAIAFVEATKDFRYDQVKCERDSGIIVDSIIQDLLYPTEFLSQSTFAGLQYWNQNGYIGEIPNELTTTTAAIAYVSEVARRVVQNTPDGGTGYQSTVTQYFTSGTVGTTYEVNFIDDEFTFISDLLNGNIADFTNQIVPNGTTVSETTSTISAYDLLIANKDYIIAEGLAFVEDVKGVDYQYDSVLCARDIGYMIDSVAFDLLHTGNRQALQSGLYYYAFNNASSAIPNETAQTMAAFEYIKVLTAQIAQNIAVEPIQQSVPQAFSTTGASADVIATVQAPTEKIIKIVENGPDAILTKQPISLTRTTNANVELAANLINENRDFIIAETVAYVNKYLTYQYDRDACARDVGFIIDSVGFDLLYGGNRQSVQAGVYYWGYSDVSTSLPKERVASTLAYRYMKSLIGEIVTVQTTGTRYQSTITQTISLPAATGVEVETISSNIEKIVTIINDGPQAAGAKTPINLVETDNQYVRNAVNLLAANRDYIRAEVIAYVEDTQVSNDQIILPFYDMGANATLSVIRNFDLMSNIIENGPAIAPPESQGNGIFVKTGLSPNDTRVAPMITAVTTVSDGVYQVEIDQSTIGYGDNQSLYFGETAVFPLLDQYVPDRWSTRRLNPIGSMGGALIDGGVISDRSPIESFVFDAFTQVNQGGNGIKITNNGYAQLVSVFTIFCSNAVTVENGGICSITNSNSNFGDICLTAKGYGRREFSGYIKNPPVLPYFPNGVYPQGGQVNVYIADPLLRPHIALVMEVQPPSDFINVQGLPGFLSGNVNVATLTTGTIDITVADTTGFCIGQQFFVRDQYGREYDENNQPYVREGTIVADVNYQTITLNYPLNSGGGEVGNPNYFNLFSCGNAYYTVLSSTIGEDPVEPGTLLLPNQQNVQESVSLDYIYTLTEKIVANTTVTSVLQTTSTQVFDYTQSGGTGALSFIRDRLNIISDILVKGTDATPEVSYLGDLPNGAGAALTLLNKNRQFIQDELIAYVDNQFFSYSYDQDKCERDTGLIVDSIAQDLLFRSNSQSIFSAIQYWNHTDYTGKISSEITTTTAAITYVKGLAQEVVQGIIGARYTTATQVTNLTLATPAQATTIGQEFDIILNILNTGTTGVTDIIESNSLTPSTNINVIRAYDLLQANKTYIQDEAVAFVEATKTGVRYNQEKCERDAGLIVDAIALDLAFPTANQSQATFAGLQYWNQGGYTGLIEGELTTTTNAIGYLNGLTQQVVQNITTGTRYQSTVTQSTTGSAATTVEATFLNTEFELITTILTTGTSGVTDIIETGGIIASTATNTVRAYNALMANREYLQAEVVAYVEATKTPGFTYDHVKCYRDAGYMIDSVAFDLLYGGNRQAIQSAVYYYDFNGSSTAIPGEATTTTNAFAFLGTLSQQIVKGIAVEPRQSKVTQVFSASTGTSTDAVVIGDEISLINDIILTGPGVVTTKEPITLARTTSTTTLNAAGLLLANRDFIIAETISYINQEFGFDYDKDLCFRDVGYMIDAVSVDLLYGGNRQAVQSGVYYYGYASTSTAIPNEISQTVAAYSYIASLTSALILGQDIDGQQSAVSRVSGTSSTPSEAATVKELIANVTSVIANGPDSVIVNVPLSTTPSADSGTINTAKMIDANREFIVAETVAFVDETNAPGFVYDKEKCARDTGLIVDAIAQDVLFASLSQSVFAGVQYWNHDSYVGKISGEIENTTAAITYLKELAQKVVRNNTSGVRYQTAVTQNTGLTAASAAEASIIGTDFDVILNILENGTAGVTDNIVSNNLTSSTTATVVNAYAVLQANKAYLEAEVIAYVESLRTGTSYTYDKVKCARDTGLIVDALVTDLLFGGETQATFSGVQYWNHDSYVGAIAGELTTTTNAINYVKDLAQKVIVNNVSGTRYQSTVTQYVSGTAAGASEQTTLATEFSLITTILSSGVAGITDDIEPNGITSSTNVNVWNAYLNLQANKTYLQAEAVAYVESTKTVGFTYDQAKCYRDVGYMVDSISFDLLYGGNLQAIESGVYYYGYNASSTALPGEQTQSVAAYTYIKNILPNIIKGIPLNEPVQATVDQVTGGSYGTDNEVDTAQNLIDIITTIIIDGPAAANSPTSIGLTRSTNSNVIKAAEILRANREFIVAETVAYVDASFTGSFTYDQAKCARDVGYMVDAVSVDLLYSGNKQAVMSGVYYYGWNSDSTALPGEQAQAVAAYQYIRNILPDIVNCAALTTTYQSTVAQVTSGTPGNNDGIRAAQTKIDIITNIIEKGPTVSAIKQPLSIVRSTDTNVINAANLILANRNWIVAEVIAYVNRRYSTYNRVKCHRDVGLLVDALVYDLEKGGNYNAVIAGRSYYAEHGTHHIVQLEENVTDPGLFPDGAITTFYQRSYMSASGYLFEYVGSGVTYGSLPQRGVKDPVQTKETVQLNNGKVFFTSTDQNGDFRIGTGLVISQATGVLSGRTFTKSLFANLTPFILAIEGG